MTKFELKTYICKKFEGEDCLEIVQDFAENLAADINTMAHQLLLCIAIDLKFNLLSITDYSKIFKNLKSKNGLSIFLNFENAIKKYVDSNKGFMYSKHSSNLDTKPSSYVTIMKTKYMHQMLPKKVIGIPRKGRMRPSKKYYSLDQLDPSVKIIKKGINSLFWLTSADWVNGILSASDDNCCERLVDLLGLHHMNDKNIDLSYLETPTIDIETYQPNTTNGSWNHEDLFSSYLSFHKMDGWGRTYAISGKKENLNEGKERVVFSIPFKKNYDKSKFIVRPLQKIECLNLNDNQKDIIEEGIKRLKND